MKLPIKINHPEPWQTFFAGFDLGGWRQADGSIKSHSLTTVIPDWPKEITVFGNTYTLEKIEKGVKGWENALYV